MDWSAHGLLSPVNALAPIVSAASLGFLAPFWVHIGAKAAGANILRATTRVTFWGALAMVLTARNRKSLL